MPQANIIADLERHLSALGYDPGVLDGVPDPAINDALRAYQADRGLEPTGAVDMALFERIAAEAQNLGQGGGDFAVIAPPSASDAVDPLTAPAAVGADEMIAEEIDGYVFHRLATPCTGEIGIGVYSYGVPVAIQELSEICINRAAGRIRSSEPMDNFTFIETVAGLSFFQDLQSATQEEFRHQLMISAYAGYGNVAALEAGLVNFAHAHGPTIVPDRHSLPPAVGAGYVTRALFANDGTSDVMELAAALSFLNLEEGEPTGRAAAEAGLSYLALGGRGAFSGAGLNAPLNHREFGAPSDTGTVALLADPSGRLSGRLSVSLAEIPGQLQPTRPEGTIVFSALRGFWSGPDGQDFMLLGLTDVPVTRADGSQVTLTAYVELSGGSVAYYGLGE